MWHVCRQQLMETVPGFNLNNPTSSSLISLMEDEEQMRQGADNTRVWYSELKYHRSIETNRRSIRKEVKRLAFGVRTVFIVPVLFNHKIAFSLGPGAERESICNTILPNHIIFWKSACNHISRRGKQGKFSANFRNYYTIDIAKENNINLQEKVL